MNGKGQKASDTIACRLLLLARLPRAPRRTTSGKLKSHLEGEGHYVSLRTIERDLEQLEGRFPIVCDRREKPYGWSWDRGAEPLAIPGMSVHQAVVLLTAQAHLRSQLPANLYRELQPLFAQAHSTLGQKQPQAGTWPHRVAHVDNSQPLIAPEIAEDVLLAVHTALYHGHQLEIGYQRRGVDETRQHRIHPLLLIQRGPVLYLAGQIEEKPQPTLFALHRIRRAKTLPSWPSMPLDAKRRQQIIAEVSAGFSQGERIELRLHMRRELAIHIEEGPLAKDQQSRAIDDNWTEITASVHDSAQLRWWLLGFGAGVRVKAPEALAVYIRQQHYEAAGA
ncbi:transcriptional factor [Lysobacteraceae bacterium NML71-0210]|nr:transcriptional factor [Xanthomonadaceae bacterium NML71-0210]